MALRIEKAFGVKMDTLMRMQSAYDIAQTRKREKEIRVRRISPYRRHSPMNNQLYYCDNLQLLQDSVATIKRPCPRRHRQPTMVAH